MGGDGEMEGVSVSLVSITRCSRSLAFCNVLITARRFRERNEVRERGVCVYGGWGWGRGMGKLTTTHVDKENFTAKIQLKV